MSAEVVIPALQRVTRVSPTGDFLLAGLPAGQHEVVIRSVGFKALQLQLSFSGHDTLTRDVELEAAPGESVTQLPAVPVTAKADPIRTGKLAEFDRRRTAGNGGQFITRDVFAQRESSTLAEVMRLVPGHELVRLGNGGWAVAEGRGRASILGQHYGGDQKRGDPRKCYAQIFLDGIQVYQSTPGVSPPDLRDFAVNTIEGIEFYSGPATTPPEFNATGSACGTLAIWTRVK